MKETEFWKEGMDAKRFALCIKSRIWYVLAAALAGALFAGGIYLIARQLTKGETKYRAEVLYSIGYDIQEEDEVLKEFINEYNAYTWGDMMKSDRVILPVMEAVPETDRATIEASISTDIASDPEFLSVFFTTNSAELSNRIAVAYNGSMAAFGQTMQGRGLTGIEAWKSVPAKEVVPENKVLHAAGLGVVLGLLFGALVLAARYVLDDSVLLETDITKKYALPVFGYRTARPEERWEAALQANLNYQAQKGAFREVLLSEVTDASADFAQMREVPVVLVTEWGTSCTRILGHVLETLKLQDVQVLGILIAEANNDFLRAYYGKAPKMRYSSQ